jgi:Animal haem peroxidase
MADTQRDADDIERPSEIFPSITTPTELHRHAFPPQRGIDVLPSSSFKTGRFGRMFRHLPVFEHEDPVPKLTALAERMIAPGGPPADNPDIPSGYTYLGQFIDHDITFDPVSSLIRQNDPDALHNFRTPRFDLDSVYGRGPSDQPYLYEVTDDITRMKLGEDVGVVPGQPSGAGPDLPRNEPRERDGQDNFFGRALLGDPRNDENLLVSQLHLTMLQFHNKVVDHVAATTPLRKDNLFKEAQRRVRWHYQWVVVHDFLRRVVGDAVVDDILKTERLVVGGNGDQVDLVRPKFQFYNPTYDAFMPVEFSVAAYRFGHSMIRGRYHINTFVRDARGDQGPIPIFGPERPPDELSNLNGFRRLPPQWAVEWKFLFDLPGADVQAQPSLLIDAQLAGPLANLPPEVADPPRSLAARNLLRGLRLGLPAGTTVARAMGIEPLGPDQLGIGDISEDLALHPPLWFYVLKEAEVLEQGRRLGPVGGRIVAEVLLGILANDPLSHLSVEPNWKPEAPLARDDGSFDMPRLIEFAKQP